MHKLSRILIIYVLLVVVACGQVTEDSEVVLSDYASQSGEVASGSVMLNEDKGDTVSSSESSIGSLVDSPSGGAFRRLWADPPTLDPHLTSDTTSAGIVVEVFSGLVALDTDLNLVPDIAEGWSIDGNTYTFNLRDNVQFHNGRQVKAEDFKWSIERAADPVTASPVADTYLNDIVGAMEYIRGEADSISGIKVIDDLTLQITVDAPKAYFLAKMTYPTAYVVDRNVVEAGGRNWWVGDPIGTGPFKLDEYRIGER
ncbi:MAG: ABC transporter substrate-binding protein, partial [Anaerolineales bacterium]|nr:ABC transporter substrate-binding protein [Anaerolineales bacterium]